MKVKELIEHLQKLPLDDRIIITSMDDYFSCSNFEVASPKEGEAQEIILNVYVNNYHDAEEMEENIYYYFEGRIYETKEQVLKATENYINKNYDTVATFNTFEDFESNFDFLKSTGLSDIEAFNEARY